MTLVEPKADTTRVARARATDVDIATTRPGTPGGTFMRQFWMALDNSTNLAPGRAKPIGSSEITRSAGSGKAQVAHALPASRRHDASRVGRRRRHRCVYRK